VEETGRTTIEDVNVRRPECYADRGRPRSGCSKAEGSAWWIHWSLRAGIGTLSNVSSMSTDLISILTC